MSCSSGAWIFWRFLQIKQHFHAPMHVLNQFRLALIQRVLNKSKYGKFKSWLAHCQLITDEFTEICPHSLGYLFTVRSNFRILHIWWHNLGPEVVAGIAASISQWEASIAVTWWALSQWEACKHHFLILIGSINHTGLNYPAHINDAIFFQGSIMCWQRVRLSGCLSSN